LRNITADWGRATREWREAMSQFAILYDDRFTRPGAYNRTRRPRPGNVSNRFKQRNPAFPASAINLYLLASVQAPDPPMERAIRQFNG
jgi:hypothetical protein